VGKTRIATEVVRRFSGRVLWIAHRIELVQQAIESLTRELGEDVGVEAPDRYSSRERVVIASKDTVRTERRLDRLRSYKPFDLIVIDECHHSAAKSYLAVLNTFPKALRYGLTATPGRLDKRPLPCFDCQTEPYGIVPALSDGWLVPILARRVRIEAVDLSGVRTLAGDFNQGELDAIMRAEEASHGIAKAILDRLSAGPAISFVTSVDVAERQAEILNRYQLGIARFVSGKTPDQERRRTFAEFGKQYRVLVNVGVATEGTDLPSAAVIAMGRPTKSTALFQQMLGRGLRPLPGVADAGWNAERRKELIRDSAKSHCLVLDFVGNTGKHTVATATDVIGVEQELSSAVRERVNAKIEAGQEIDVAAAVAEELQRETEEKQRRAKRRERDSSRRQLLVGTVRLTEESAELIGLGASAEDDSERARSIWNGPPTPGQVTELGRLGIAYDGIQTAKEARDRIAMVRAARNLATPKQLDLIRKYRPKDATTHLTKSKARWLIGQIMKGWRR
jgi:ATP-dependent helicase IRC3